MGGLIDVVSEEGVRAMPCLNLRNGGLVFNDRGSSFGILRLFLGIGPRCRAEEVFDVEGLHGSLLMPCRWLPQRSSQCFGCGGCGGFGPMPHSVRSLPHMLYAFQMSSCVCLSTSWSNLWSARVKTWRKAPCNKSSISLTTTVMSLRFS